MNIPETLTLNKDKPNHNKSNEAVPSGLKTRDFNLKTAALIKSQIGDIEEIRHSLCLSKRKICQLLLIDPSTWTRWTCGKTNPPPYIYRTLQWGLAIMNKYPETHPLANYEKFEQIKKIEELRKRLNAFEQRKISSDENLKRYHMPSKYSKSLLPLSILILACVLLIKL